METLNEKDRDEIIDSLLLVEEKRDKTLKGRTVARGDQQKKHLTKEEVHSPTVNTTAVFLTATIEAEEERDVRVYDVPNAFVQSDNDERVIMKVKGVAAELLLKTDPSLYRKYVIHEKGVVVLYVELRKALYGQLKAALLYYLKFVSDIKEIGFKLNPYDPCVANRMVNGHQHTICWHVDDIKSSHVDPAVQDEFEKWLTAKYDTENGVVKGKLTKCTGKRLDYLGMVLDFSVPKEVSVEMSPYVQSMIDEWKELEPIKGRPNTPAALHLFEVREDVEKLSEQKAQWFHHFTAKALYVCKRARPDIQPTVAFLTTRVKQPDEDDWKKLQRLMAYLNDTKDLKLRLKSDGAGVVQWWIDASYATHHDASSHTGVTMSLGVGSILSKSSKQKLNTTSSTEAELVGVYDGMIELLWVKYFLEAQGYVSYPTVLWQDNKSAILLEKNGKRSSGKRTKHINVRYYFVHDKWKRKELDIKFCPTEDMVGDFFTKPLQGAGFIKFRNKVLGAEKM